MLQHLLDTDHLTLFEHIHVAVWRHYLQESPGTVGISFLEDTPRNLDQNVVYRESLTPRMGEALEDHACVWCSRASGFLP
jgi:hypothetical protein